MSLRPSKKTGLLWGLRGIGALEHQDKSMRGHSKRKAAVHKEKKGSTETPPTYILLLDFQSPKLSLSPVHSVYIIIPALSYWYNLTMWLKKQN